MTELTDDGEVGRDSASIAWCAYVCDNSVGARVCSLHKMTAMMQALHFELKL